MSEITRKKHTGEPGNPGHFGSRPNSESDVSLPAGAPVESEGYERTVHLLIWPSELRTLELSVRKANGRLHRAGIEQTFEFEALDTIVQREGNSYAMVDVALNSPCFSHDGWEVTGVYDFTEDGEPLVFMRNDDHEVSNSHCDVCNTNRHRGRVVTISHRDKGTMQVGTTCLQPYTGISPTGLWALGADPLDLDDIALDPDMVGFARNRPNARPVDDLLLAAVHISCGGDNYVSRLDAGPHNPSTASLVRESDTDSLRDSASDDEIALATKIKKWVLDDTSDSTYMQNLRTAVGGESGIVRDKHLGIVVSAVSSYRSAQRRIAEKAAHDQMQAGRKQEFLASPKEKLADLPATVLNVYSFESDYGYPPQIVEIIIMQTDSGHVAVWKTAANRLDLSSGSRVCIDKATVKANEVREQRSGESMWQTIVSRAKLSDLRDSSHIEQSTLTTTA